MRISSSASSVGVVVDDRDAEARLDDDLLLIQAERHLEQLDDPLGDLRRLLRPGGVLEQDRELVAAEPGGGVADTDARRQSLGDLEQHAVAGGVTEAVVDRLEVVEVEEDHRELEVLAPRPGQSVADALVEQRAVGELRDRIVKRLMLELRLERLALADVATVEDDPRDRLVLDQVGVQDLEVPGAPVGVAQRALDHLGLALAVAGAVREQAHQTGVLAGHQQPIEPRPEDLLGRVAERLLDRRALVDHHRSSSRAP